MRSVEIGARRKCRHTLVTGGAGFIGSRLVSKLCDQGVKVRVLDNLSTGKRESVDPRAAFVEGDIRSLADVKSALQGVDCIFHLAAQVTIRGSLQRFYDDVDNNLMGTLNLLRSLDPGVARRFILASSMAVYADSPVPQPIPETYTLDPISPYGVSKLSAERICHQVLDQNNIPFTALRYFNTFGPGQSYTPYVGVITIFITRLLSGDIPIIFGDGEQKRDFVHVDDVVEGTIKSLWGPPGVYNLGTGRALSILELANLLIAKIRPDVQPRFAPAEHCELRFSVADIGAASAHLGYFPKKSLLIEIDSVIDSIKKSMSCLNEKPR